MVYTDLLTSCLTNSPRLPCFMNYCELYSLIKINFVHYTTIVNLQEGYTALHFAAMEGYVEILDLLLKKGSNVNLTAGVCSFQISFI